MKWKMPYIRGGCTQKQNTNKQSKRRGGYRSQVDSTQELRLCVCEDQRTHTRCGREAATYSDCICLGIPNKTGLPALGQQSVN